jgi:hypothetical protein
MRTRFRLKLMEVCGGHTHTIYKHGLEDYLPDSITLVHGPGGPAGDQRAPGVLPVPGLRCGVRARRPDRAVLVSTRPTLRG